MSQLILDALNDPFKRKIIEARFWENVDKGEPNECWKWTGSDDGEHGYGKFFIYGDVFRAHRLSMILDRGVLVHNALHICDNPPCVNPAHLYDGTQKENARDRSIRKPHSFATGEQSGSAILTPHSVREMRLFDEIGNFTPVELATMFGVTRSQVYDVLNGKAWKLIPVSRKRTTD